MFSYSLIGDYMNYLKKIGFSLGSWVIMVLIFSFINTIFNYFDVYNYNVYVIISFIIVIISSLISGFIIGQRSLKRGWLEGIKLGLICIFILFVFNFLAFNQGYSISNFINYGIVLISNILGSMIGINTKKDR